MPTFRCLPLPGGHVPPPISGSAVGGPKDWTVSDEVSASGDVLRLDVQSPPEAPTGFKLTHYEVALSQRGGATTIRRVLGGPATNYVRRFKTDTPQTPQRVQLRAVWQKLNQFTWQSDPDPDYIPQVGDAALQPSTGASATVRAIVGLGNRSYYLVVDDIVGTFEDETPVTIAGNGGSQGSAMHCTHLDAERVTLRSEWSLPQDIIPVTGAPRVTITANTTACLQGEAVLLQATAEGFETERPCHDLHYHFRVTKTGEQGPHAALPDAFEACFGPGSNNRAEGYSQVWAFAPRTTGTVTVTCDVRDGDGNVATGTLDLTVAAPVSTLPDAAIYAASSSLRPVPGAPEANIFATLAELEAALPTGGEGMILLDTADLHSPTDFTDIFLQDFLTERCIVMPYSASGVGPDAGGRATLNRALASRANHFVAFGLNLIGPFDPTDPFSITDYPEHGCNLDLAGTTAIAECDIIGWRESVKLPFSENVAAYVDLYITDYQNFGFFGGDVGPHAMSGCYVFTNPKSWRAPGKSAASDNATVGFFVDHGPYRSSRPDGPRGFSKSVFFSCCSWGGTGYPQNPLRLYGNGATPKPEVTHGTEVLTEGGALSINSTTRGGGDTTGHPQEFIWDKFFHITSMQPGSAMTIGLGGATVRNGVFVTSSQPYEVNSSGVRHHLSFTNESPVPGQNDNENNPIRVSYITIADLRVDSGQNTQSLVVSATNPDYPMNDIQIADILTYAPNFTLNDIAAAPVDTTPRWTPLYEGHYWWNADTPTLAQQTIDLSWATPDEVTASFEPGPGSSAYQTAVTRAPYDDLRSRVRPAQASRGAHDPGGS